MVERCIENIVYFYNFLTDLNRRIFNVKTELKSTVIHFSHLNWGFRRFQQPLNEVFVFVIANVNNLVYTAFNLTR